MSARLGKRAWLARWAPDTVDFSEPQMAVVFGETRGQARQAALFPLDLERSDFASTDLHVVRSPQFDQYADRGEVPDSALLADGWCVECAGCYGEIGPNAEDDEPVIAEDGRAALARYREAHGEVEA